ncbi:transposase [Enterobacter bugandensis]|nr:transposase [Enterobacter bugandensis]
MRIDFSHPETPTDNETVESFNGRLRQECLNENGFMSLEDDRCKIEAWRIHCNQRRPYSAPGWMTPSEYAAKLKPDISDYEWITYGERINRPRREVKICLLVWGQSRLNISGRSQDTFMGIARSILTRRAPVYNAELTISAC